MSTCVHLFCWLVGSSAGLHKNCHLDFHETWMEDGSDLCADKVFFFFFLFFYCNSFVDAQKEAGGRWADVRSSQCRYSLSLVNSIAALLP